MIGLHDIDWVNRKTEIGYWISQEYQGLGIISRSCRALISYTFEHLKLHRLEIQCAKQNLASRRIPEKLGFQQEALLRESIFLHGEFSDLILYGLLASQWHIPVKKNL
jgi:ribosomal-protein-serine acetyltransferase